MDPLKYEQYASVLQFKQVSLDALQRIIRHDRESGWTQTPGGLARQKVLEDCLNNKIKGYKLHDEEGDKLYGVEWPLPLIFERSR